MQSFRTEIENTLVEKDIIELERKIRQFKEGKIDSEKFRSLRLARGVYGQRQEGVQMIRIKIPYGKLTTKQLLRISDVADEYSTGRLHTTTRQDIQIHYVSLDRTPELWSELEKDDITLREACGNAVRNVVGSPLSGIEKDEVFDVSPYAKATFEYFLRQPFGQELGRKFKIAFSNNDKDSGLAYINDLGFIAKVKNTPNGLIRGFKPYLAGGLGAQAFEPQELFDFLPEDQVIPLIEATVRIFDRYGERNKRHKARIKYLIKDIGLEQFKILLKEEQLNLKNQFFKIDIPAEIIPESKNVIQSVIEDYNHYQKWLKSNVIKQKQEGFFAVTLKLQNGDFYTNQAREIADLVSKVAEDDIRITPTQNLILKFIRKENLPFVYNELDRLGLNDFGAEGILDITACPGTDTCNLGISNSTGTAIEIENFLLKNYPEIYINEDIKIKISGCMNACGQHTIANIGLHGSSVKGENGIAPALQVLLGGSRNRLADKVIKIPSKRILKALDVLIQDYFSNANNQLFNEYYDAKGKIYFFNLLKPFNNVKDLETNEYIDWHQEEKYEREVGVGECAGVVIDLIDTLFLETEEKLDLAKEALESDRFNDSIYFSYSAIINSIKAILTFKGVNSNSHISTVDNFNEMMIQSGELNFNQDIHELIFEFKKIESTKEFAQTYLNRAIDFDSKIRNYHSSFKTLENVN